MKLSSFFKHTFQLLDFQLKLLNSLFVLREFLVLDECQYDDFCADRKIRFNVHEILLLRILCSGLLGIRCSLGANISARNHTHWCGAGKFKIRMTILGKFNSRAEVMA